MKKFLIYLSLLFSFLFIGNVKAATNLSDCSFFTYTDEQISSKITQLQNYITSQGYNGSTYNKFVLQVHKFSGNIYSSIYLFNDEAINSRTIYFNAIDNQHLSAYQPTNSYLSGKMTGYKVSNVSSLGNASLISGGGLNIQSDNNVTFYYLSNFDIKGSNGNILYPQNYNSAPPTYTINFHLNGGYIIDDNTSQSSSGSGHSSGGGIHDDNDGNIIDEDFSIEINKNDINNYIANIIPKKNNMLFDGWFYDNNFINEFSINDTITSDIHVYAKWRYEHVDDFLDNTNFNEYTFDKNYDYVIISRGNYNGDVYIGLPFLRNNLEVYRYNETLNNYDNEKGYCPTSLYSKNNIYYYNLSNLDNNYQDVLVIPKKVFEHRHMTVEELSDIEGNTYKFYLSDNAYITYTNNLDETIIYDSSGNQITTDLEETYQIFQETMIEDEKDLFSIFRNLINFKDNRVLSYINIVWNKIKRTQLNNYFLILIVGGLIILIIKSARRN